VYAVCVSIESSTANELVPLGARYTLYPAIGSLDPFGAFQLNSTWRGFPVPLRGTVRLGLADEVLLIVSCPVAAPAADGLNVSVNVIACPGFKVAGRVGKETEKPVPVAVIDFTVTAAVPLEVRVTVCVVGVFTATPPKEMLVALRVRADAAAFSCSETAFEVLPVVAVSVADCALLTAAAFAVNDALAAVAGTITELGTVTALLLLARDTLTPPVGADPDKLTVHVSASDPVIEVLLQFTALKVGAIVVPVPLRFTVAVGALLDIDNCPVAELAVVGSN
jgi:hypothetical protein